MLENVRIFLLTIKNKPFGNLIALVDEAFPPDMALCIRFEGPESAFMLNNQLDYSITTIDKRTGKNKRVWSSPIATTKTTVKTNVRIM